MYELDDDNLVGIYLTMVDQCDGAEVVGYTSPELNMIKGKQILWTGLI